MAMFQKFRHLSKNHLILVLLCAVIGYLLRSHDTFELRPVWRKRAEFHHFENKKFPTKAEQLPPPVITDLDSDGVNEIVLITNDLKLSVMTLPEAAKQDVEDRTLPHVVMKNKIVLPRSVNGSNTEPSGWPVVMVTGFTSPYLSMLQVRHQVIVIVTNTWWVLCYSSDLQLMWHKQLLDFKEQFDNYYVKSMGALVTAQRVKKSDEGLVIVGGSYAHKAHKEETVDNKGNETHADHTTEEDTFTHFSSFALNAKDGTTRWHHLPGEFGEQETKPEKEHTEHHWKLSLKRHRLHVGESPWTFFKQELYKSLPHQWRTVRDTSFTLGRYQKVTDDAVFREDEEEPVVTAVPTQSALDAKHIIGYAYGGQRPHSDIEHIANPNAVVIKHQNGVEVLNILTGRPVTRLPLPDDGAIYTILDEENDIKKLSWGEQENFSPCFIEIFRIFPIKENLERYQVCVTKRLFFTNNWVYDEDMFVKLPPLVMKSVARKSGVVRHLLGHHLRKEVDQYDIVTLGSMGRVTSVDKNGDFNWQAKFGPMWNLLGHHLRTEVDQYDIVTLGSMGRVTSVDKNGDFNWQAQTSAKWDSISSIMKKMKKGEWTELSEEFKNSFHPDRALMPLQLYGDKTNLLVVGWQDISLLELTEGRILAEHSTPCPSTGPLVVGDFNNDGFNDVIFTCKFGYIGFSLHRQSNHMYTMSYGLAVFLIILLIGWILSPDRQKVYESDEDID